MIFVTGDTHAEFSRFSTKRFPEQKEMTKDDYVIICGDFGGIWNYLRSDVTELYWLKWLEEKPFTILFVDGNHENFDRLNKEFKVVNYHGGKAHKISDNIYHLMRGYVFEFEGKKFFTFGGASSHDIDDGILKIEDYPTLNDLVKDYNKRTKAGQMLRIDHISWWEKELPTYYEMQRGKRELEKVNYEVDYVITHCAPQEIASYISYGCYKPDILTMYLGEITRELKFTKWHFGHYHNEQVVMGKFVLHYNRIERIL